MLPQTFLPIPRCCPVPCLPCPVRYIPLPIHSRSAIILSDVSTTLLVVLSFIDQRLYRIDLRIPRFKISSLCSQLFLRMSVSPVSLHCILRTPMRNQANMRCEDSVTYIAVKCGWFVAASVTSLTVLNGFVRPALLDRCCAVANS